MLQEEGGRGWMEDQVEADGVRERQAAFILLLGDLR